MTSSDSSAAMNSRVSPRVRRQMFWLALGALALAIVVGSIWVLGRNGPATTPVATGVQHVGEHPDPAHVDSQSHAAAPSAMDPHMDGMSSDHSASEALVEPAAHGHDEPGAHTEAEATAHADAQVGHEAGGHGVEAAAVPASTKQIVLSGIAGFNALVILAAGILRRRHSPRLPKHLQRQLVGASS